MVAQLALDIGFDAEENPSFLTEQLITYIGNKRALLSFIGAGLQRSREILGADKLRFLDLFAGSGIVSRYAKRFASIIYANDLEKYSAVINSCYLTNYTAMPWKEVQEALKVVEHFTKNNQEPGFITRLYAPIEENAITVEDRVFYTRKNAIFLDNARNSLKQIDSGLRKYLLAPLLSAASVHANTSGVFKGFYKDGSGRGKFGGTAGDALKRICEPIVWRLPVLSSFECSAVISNSDANDMVRNMESVDVAYFDPPYNQHPYGSNYFMLNLLLEYKEPTEISRVSGIPTDWKRSKYNTRAASATALFDAIDRCKAKIVLISYSSEGFIPYEQFVTYLSRLGKLEVLDTQYNTFRGCRNLKDRPSSVTEFLFLVDKR